MEADKNIKGPIVSKQHSQQPPFRKEQITPVITIRTKNPEEIV